MSKYKECEMEVLTIGCRQRIWRAKTYLRVLNPNPDASRTNLSCTTAVELNLQMFGRRLFCFVLPMQKALMVDSLHNNCLINGCSESVILVLDGRFSAEA